MSDCVKPKNQANIDKAKTTWQNNRKQSNGGNSGDKGKSADKNGYSRSKFEKPAAAQNGLQTINGVPHAPCKTCGWAIDHSTKYHDAWAANPQVFCLPVDHPLSKAKARSTTPAAAAACAAVPVPPSEGNALMMSSMIAHFDKMESNCSDPDQSTLAGALKSLFQGKV